MQLITDKRVQDFVVTLSEQDQGRISRYQDLFSEYGFTLSAKYLKKIDSNLWELRPSNLRLLLGWSGTKKLMVIVHYFKKKTQKTPIKEIETAQMRLKQYQLL